MDHINYYDDDAKRCSFVWCVYNTIEVEYPNIIEAGFTTEKLSKIVGKDFDEDCLNYLHDSNGVIENADLLYSVLTTVSNYYIGEDWYVRHGDRAAMDLFGSKLLTAIESETDD